MNGDGTSTLVTVMENGKVWLPWRSRAKVSDLRGPVGTLPSVPITFPIYDRFSEVGG
jgi:hypothetical protein